MRRNIGTLAGGFVGFVVAYFGVAAPLAAPDATTAPLRASPPAATSPGERVAASLVTLEASAAPHDAVTAPTAPSARTGAVATSEPAPEVAQRRTFLVHGIVTARGGGTLAGAYVSVQLPAGGRSSATTDTLGRYTLGPLEPRAWSVSAGMTDHHTVSAEVAPPGDGALVRRDFELAPQQVVRVRLVTSEGAPALGALAAARLYWHQFQLVPVATRDDPGPTFTEVTGSLSNPFGIGWFREPGPIGRPAVTADEYGTVTIREDGPAWLSLVAAHQVLAKQALAPGTDEVTFVVDPSDITALYATVRGRALDAVSGGAVTALAWVSEGPFASDDRGGAGADPMSGDFAVERALPGRKWLIVKCEGYAQVTRRVTVPRGATFEAGDVLMHRPVKLSGRVQDAGGKPYEAQVEWGVLDTASGAVAWAQQVRTRSQPDGVFTIPGLEPAVYVVRSPGLEARGNKPSDARLGSRPVRVDARAGSVEAIALLLEPTTVVTLAAPQRVQPTGGAWTYAVLLDAKGLPLARGWPGRYADETPLHVPPGECTLVLTRNGVELERRTLVVGEAPLRLELDAP